MKRIIPIKIVNLEELKPDDLVSALIVNIVNNDDYYFKMCHTWDVWKFNGFINKDSVMIMDCTIFIGNKWYIGKEGHKWTPYIPNKDWERWMIVKVIDDALTDKIEIDDCNIKEIGRPKNLEVPGYSQGKENQTNN